MTQSNQLWFTARFIARVAIGIEVTFASIKLRVKTLSVRAKNSPPDEKTAEVAKNT